MIDPIRTKLRISIDYSDKDGGCVSFAKVANKEISVFWMGNFENDISIELDAKSLIKLLKE